MQFKLLSSLSKLKTPCWFCFCMFCMFCSLFFFFFCGLFWCLVCFIADYIGVLKLTISQKVIWNGCRVIHLGLTVESSIKSYKSKSKSVSRVLKIDKQSSGHHIMFELKNFDRVYSFKSIATTMEFTIKKSFGMVKLKQWFYRSSPTSTEVSQILACRFDSTKYEGFSLQFHDCFVQSFRLNIYCNRHTLSIMVLRSMRKRFGHIIGHLKSLTMYSCLL